MNIFELIRRIEALEAERDALLVELAPLRELRAAGIEPADILWDHRYNPISLTLIFYGVGDDCAKSITRPLNRCLFEKL